MIDTGTALIVSSFTGLIGAIIIIQLNNNNWFKRKNFLQGQKVETLKLKKLERDLGLKGTIKQDPKEDLISKAIEKYAPAVLGSAEDGEGGWEEILGNIITSDAGQEILKKFTGKQDQEQYINIQDR